MSWADTWRLSIRNSLKTIVRIRVVDGGQGCGRRQVHTACNTAVPTRAPSVLTNDLPSWCRPTSFVTKVINPCLSARFLLALNIAGIILETRNYLAWAPWFHFKLDYWQLNDSNYQSDMIAPLDMYFRLLEFIHLWKINHLGSWARLGVKVKWYNKV